MFGPPGSLTEASLQQAAGTVPEAWGAFPRAMIELLAAPELAGATFHASAIEIYMEHAYDLLDGRKPVKVGSAKGSGRGTLVVADMGKAPVWSGDVKICSKVDRDGRSHKRLFLFVDLAGSERIAKTEVTGERQKEAANINQSLTALGRVVKELNDRSAHVSYRDAALTMLLRSSFDGPSCTRVVVNVSSEAEHAEESVCSLRFGEKLASVQTSAVAEQPTDVAAQRGRVGAELRAARAKLAELEQAGQGDHILADALPSEQKTLRQNIATLAEREAEVRSLKVQLVEAKASTVGGTAANGGGGGGEAQLGSRLAAAAEKHAMILDIVEKEKTIKSLWHPATPAYRRAEALVAELASQMEMLGGT